MYQDIAQLHDKVLEFLLEKRKEEPELYFTMRKEPKGLAKGHWFFGNTENLYFSFWKGIDWDKNLPNISITITLTEQVTVFLNNSQGGQKDILFEEITQNVDGFRRLSNNYQWKKTFDTYISWQEALSDFIENDKGIIDALLSKYNNDIDGLTLIKKKEFDTSVKINKISRESFVPINQPIITQNFGKTLQLTHLKLVNIKHFEQIEIDLTKRVTILIGENGSGKSTLLSAIALGLTGHDVFSQNINNPYFDSKKNAYLKIDSVNKGEHRYAKNGSIHLSYKIENENYTNEVGFETIENEAYPQPYSSVKASLSKILLAHQEYKTALNTFVIGFPQGKGYKKETTEFQKVQYPEPLELLPLITNTVNENYIDELATWLGEQRDKYYENKSKQNNDSAEANKQAINLVFSIISLIVSNGENSNAVEFDWDNFIRKDNKPIVFIKKPDTPQGIDLDLISAGYRNLFYWIGGIVSRLYKLNDFYNTNEQFKHLYKDDIRQHSGIVLIDEIDTYLHPSWQRNILKVLVEKFDKLQFAVTTHSPLVITHFDRENVYIIRNGRIIPSPFIKGRDYNSVLEDAFKVEGRPLEYANKIKRFYSYLETDVETAKNILAELKQDFGSNDTEIVRAESYLEMY